MVDAALEQTCRCSGGSGTCRRAWWFTCCWARACPGAGLPRCLAQADRWAELASGAGPFGGALAQARRRVGPEPLRFLLTCCAARPRSRAAGVPGGTGCWSARSTALAERAGHPGEPDPLQQAGRQPRRRRLPAGTPAGPGRLRHPDRDGRRVGPTAKGETTYAAGLGAAWPNMIVLADRNFASGSWPPRSPGPGGVLIRARTERCPRLPGCAAAATARTDPASAASRSGHRRPDHGHHRERRRTGLYRLVTSLQDDTRHPASSLAALYHERWKSRRPTSSSNPPSSAAGSCGPHPRRTGQEIYALLVAYQVLRTAIADAAGTVPAPIRTA